MAAAPPAVPHGPLVIEPVGCDQCGSMSLSTVGAGKFQCDYCGAFMLEREPPPLPPPAPHADTTRPPPSAINKVSAIEVLALDARGEVPAPAVETVGHILDKNGPKGFFRPKPLSKFVNVKDISAFTPIRIQYRVFFEQRRYEEVMHPYRSEVPQTGPLPPIWEAPLNPPREVMTRAVPVRAQERVETCPRCGGDGKITCGSCGGQGRTDCVWCTGGETVTRSFRNGQWVEDRQRCMPCQGRGWERCSTCRGKGRVTCDLCQGQCRVLVTWERVEEFTLPTAMEALSHGRDWSTFSWMSHAQGELVFDRVVPGRMDLTEADGPIAQLADQVMLRHNGQLHDGVCHWSRFLVTHVPVAEADYTVRSSPGRLHIYGKDQQVSMNKKPVGCMGCLFWTVSALGAGFGAVGAGLMLLL